MHVCVCLTGPAPPVLIVGEEAGPYHLVLSSITLIARPPVVHVSKKMGKTNKAALFTSQWGRASNRGFIDSSVREPRLE